MLKEIARTFRNVGQYLSLVGASNEVAEPKLVSHSKWLKYLEERYNRGGMRVLEVGSRAVTGAVFRPHFTNAKYIGFDIYEGPNVDVVGDAHKMSDYFDEGEKFDLIFSSAVFEHLHMPWIVVQEIQKLLKVGGCVFVETHFSFSSHERPSNFFQFSDLGLRALFNDALGFEWIDGGMSNPMRGYFSLRADKYLRYVPIKELYCHSAILCKKVREVTGFDWNNCAITDLVEGAQYPLVRDERK